MSMEATTTHQNNEERDPNLIDAEPTKELFIDMLIRDLPLIDAICDLADNSVDGARKLRPNKDYSGLFINIELGPEYFTISDNCGGIPVDIARYYAFRFGRPANTPPTPNTIGQFGIGMKRALFKLGSKFTVKSKTTIDSFTLEVDVNQWKASKQWSFSFTDLLENQAYSLQECFTNIHVTRLRKETIGQFNDNVFTQRLRNKLELRNSYTLHRKLEIKLLNETLKSRIFEFRDSPDLRTSYWKSKLTENLSVEIYAGVSDPKLEEGGWYIFGNERLIIGPDQTSKTGWGNRTALPVYHGQYDRFRGIVLFEASDASFLPWNTSKNDIDIDSPSYKATLVQMAIMGRPIITFLNNLKDERGQWGEGQRDLENALEKAPKVSLTNIDTSSSVRTEAFAFPKPKSRPKSNVQMTKITYSKPKTHVQAVQKSLNVSSAKEAGELTFDFYYDSEID